jgi:predicted TIM-barrel fold metal-dependent hydrolase
LELLPRSPRLVDCDVHPTLASTRQLFPYVSAHWRETLEDREVLQLDTISYPPNAPLTARKDWRDANGRAATNVTELAHHALDRWAVDLAICNCIYGVHLVMNEDMAVVLASAVNDWLLDEWLSKDTRLRASIVVPWQSIPGTVKEIGRRAADHRFIQVLAPCMGEAPLGRRQYWPVLEAAEAHDLPIGIHAGSSYRHPVTSLGWPTYYAEDYASQSQGFQAQVASLICEGAFARFPKLKVVLIESGVTWLPAFMWRLTKFWFGLRSEVPWVQQPPWDIVREHFRLTTQPFDSPADPEIVRKAIAHLHSDDVLLFSSDFPHWQFDADAFLPDGIPEPTRTRLMSANALATYKRLSTGVFETGHA